MLSVLTWRQVRYWSSDVTLWSRALQVTDNNFVAEENLGVALLELGRDEEALPHLTNAVKIVPGDPTARLNLGTNLARHRLLPETAIAHLRAVTELSQDPAILTAAYRGLGVVYAQIGDRGQARDNFVKAARLSPGSQNEIYNLAQMDMQDSVADLSREVSAHPTPQGYFQLGQLLKESNMIPDAEIAYQDALRLDPHLDEAKRALRDLKE
jgi:tetratricopeptide (TPR) repeat protein